MNKTTLTVDRKIAHTDHWDTGRAGLGVSMVVIHDQEGTSENSIAWFLKSSAQRAAEGAPGQSSAHYVFDAETGKITLCVEEDDTAYHAGNLTINHRSIGLELEGYQSQPQQWYTEKALRPPAKMTADICRRYNIPIGRGNIIGHSEVPNPNYPLRSSLPYGGIGAKTDPGTGFPWGTFMALVREYAGPTGRLVNGIFVPAWALAEYDRVATAYPLGLVLDSELEMTIGPVKVRAINFERGRLEQQQDGSLTWGRTGSESLLEYRKLGGVKKI